MHIRFLHHGTGDPHKAVRYLLSAKDHNGHIRPEVKVLRGNPSQLASLAASLSTVHRYTSAVIAWAPEDQPTPIEVDAVLDDFERLAFAGMEPDQFFHTVVSHGDHVHVLVARVDLHTGKAMNIAPPLWRKHFDHLRDHWNHKLGWARPDDPARARPVQVGGDRRKGELGALIKAEKIAADMGLALTDVLGASGFKPTLKQIITDHLQRLTHEGCIKNRQDVVAALREFGEINRDGQDYLSIKPAQGGAPIRFKGLLFHRDFDAAEFVSRQLIPLATTRSKPNLVAAAAARNELEDAISRRIAYRRTRCLAPKPKPTQSFIAHRDDEPPIHHETEESENERNRNLVVAEAQRRLRIAQSAVASFVRSCIEAVRRLGVSEQASQAAQRASLDTERACRSVDAAIARVSLDPRETESQKQRFRS